MLRDRLFETLASADPEVDEGFDVRGGALEPGALAAWLAEHSQRAAGSGWPSSAHTSRSTATRPRWRSSPPTATVATSTPRRCIPTTRRRSASWLADADAYPRRCTRPSSRCTTWQAAAGRCAGSRRDTALAAYLVRPGQRSFALDDLSLRYLKRELRADNPEQQQLSLLDDTDGVDEQAVQTSILRASAVMDLADALDEELARIESSSLLGDMELPVQRVLAEMETRASPSTSASLRSCRASSPTRSATPPRRPTE